MTLQRACTQFDQASQFLFCNFTQSKGSTLFCLSKKLIGGILNEVGQICSGDFVAWLFIMQNKKIINYFLPSKLEATLTFVDS